MKRTLRVAALLAALAACAPPAGVPADPAGKWLAASGNVEVTIAPCGPEFCGDVTRVLANNSMEGPGPAKTQPASIGLQIFSGLHADGDGWTGHIFNREQNRSYDCHLVAGAGEMTVRVYVGLPLLGKTQVWRRVS